MLTHDQFIFYLHLPVIHIFHHILGHIEIFFTLDRTIYALVTYTHAYAALISQVVCIKYIIVAIICQIICSLFIDNPLERAIP